MNDHEVTEDAIRRELTLLSQEAAGAAKGDLARLSASKIVARAMEIVRLAERRDVECRYAHEMVLRGGVEEGNRVRFEWRDGQYRRKAEVYPNAHNGGATFGLQTNEARDGRGYDFIDKFHGADWTREAAMAAGKAWVNDGVKPGEKR